MSCKNKKVKTISLLVVIFILSIVFISIGIINFNNKSNINNILESKSYSYLPKEAKNYIKNVYENSGKIVLTEKNKKEDKPYLNPKYIEYLELSEKEKEKIELVPDTYILDYSISQSYANSELPSSFDLSYLDGKNYLTPMKNQETTEICWAFSSVETAETFLMYKNDKPFHEENSKIFSVRQMDYATANNGIIEKGNPTSYTNYSNTENASRRLGTGGNFYTSSIIMSNGLSLVDESVLPWTIENGGQYLSTILNHDNSEYEVDSTIQMPSINVDVADTDVVNSYVNEIKSYIQQYGSAFVGTYSPESTCGFTNTDGKHLIKSDDCANNKKNEGHAMQIIGWKDDYSYSYCDDGIDHYAIEENGTCSKGEKVDGQGVWILRNSWGNETEYKYVYLTYDSTRLSVGFITSMSSMDEETKTWDNNYHSNPWIDNDMSKGMLHVQSQTQSFKTNTTLGEKIEKIKFLVSSPNSTYTLSIKSGDNIYNNIATAQVDEVGIYTFDLSNMDIIFNQSEFEVTITGDDESFFANNSISVFTSNLIDDKYAETYSKHAYDPDKPLSNTNPLFIDLSYNFYHDYYNWNTKITSYLKNIPQYSELIYRIKKGDRISTNFSGNETYFYNMNIAEATFSGDSNLASNSFDIDSEYGETWTFEILYGDQIINSFPIKFNTSEEKTQSTVKLHSNHGNDYVYEYLVNDRTTNNFTVLNGNINFYNNGYYIESWNTKADGTGTSYNADDGVLIYHDGVELYAQWSDELIDLNVSFDCKYSDHCSGNMDDIKIKYNDTVVLPEVEFEKEGYNFLHWKFMDKNHPEYIYYEQETSKPISNLLNNISYTPKYYVFNNQEVIVYAVWSNNSKVLSFDPNGGTGNMKNTNIEPVIINNIVATHRIKSNLFTREGYTFKGWNTKADGTGTSYINNGSIPIDDNLTLYAQWEENKFTITFNANDGTNLSSTQFISSVTSNLNKNTFIREGYSFKEWNTKADGTGTSYSDEQSISLSSNLDLYAIWEKTFSYTINKYTVDESKKYIDKIDINTSVDDFKKNIDLNVGYSIDVSYKTIDGKNLLYTGSKTKIYKDNNLIIEYTNIIKGDITGDGLISLADLSKFYNYYQGNITMNELFELASDVNNDGKFSLADLSKFYNYYQGNINKL